MTYNPGGGQQMMGPTQQIAMFGEVKQKPSCFAVTVGVISILVALGIIAFGLFGGVASLGSGGGGAGVLVACLPMLWALFGLIAGAVACFHGGSSAGAVMCCIFLGINLIGVICGVVFVVLLAGGSGLRSY